MIVAFLQNPWFKPGIDERVIEQYRDDQRFHRKVLSQCMTGKRLMRAFKELYDEIWWDNTNWRPGNTPSVAVVPDFDHMLTTLRLKNPELVLCIGRQAYHAVMTVNEMVTRPYPILVGHHPNARHKTQADLDEFARKVREWIQRKQT